MVLVITAKLGLYQFSIIWLFRFALKIWYEESNLS